MTRRRKIILLGLLAAVPLAAGTYFGLQGLGWLMRPIPFKYMWVDCHEVDENLTTMETEKFTVSFEGDSLGRRSSGGLWPIDGRNWNWAPWKGEDKLELWPQGPIEGMGFSMSQRVFAASHLGHEIRYYDYRRLLVIDGHEFSLQDGPAHVVIAKTGELRLAPFVPSETIAEMKKAAGPRMMQNP